MRQCVSAFRDFHLVTIALITIDMRQPPSTHNSVLSLFLSLYSSLSLSLSSLSLDSSDEEKPPALDLSSYSAEKQFSSL